MKALIFTLAIFLSSSAIAQEVVVTPDRLDFPNTPVSNISHLEVTLTNNTSQTAALIDVYFTKYYPLVWDSNGCGVLGPGESCTWTISFHPAGNRSYPSNMIMEGIHPDTGELFNAVVKVRGHGYQ